MICHQSGTQINNKYTGPKMLNEHTRIKADFEKNKANGFDATTEFVLM